MYPLKQKLKQKYQRKDVSLNEFRKEEARLTKSMNRRGSSFQNLFERRLTRMGGKRERISITLIVDILDGLRITRKSYGPLTTNVPRLSTRDMNKFMVYTLLENNFTLLSAQEIVKIGCKIITYNKQFFMHHFMGALKLDSYLLSKQRQIKSYGKNTCALDYVWDQVRGKKGFKTYDYEKLKTELYSFACNPPMICPEELIDWAKNCHTNLSIHAFDSMYKKFVTHTKASSIDVTLVYVVNDHHCYPITDEKLKLVASKANQGGCDNLLKHMSDLKCTRRHENVHMIKHIDDLYDMEKGK